MVATESITNIRIIPSSALSIAITVAKSRVISGASQSSAGLRPPATRLLGPRCGIESLQTACRTSSKKVVVGITSPNLVASTTGIRSVSGDNLNRSLDRLLDLALAA